LRGPHLAHPEFIDYEARIRYYSRVNIRFTYTVQESAASGGVNNYRDITILLRCVSVTNVNDLAFVEYPRRDIDRLRLR